MNTTFYSLASKANFNKALRHFNKVMEVVDEVESKKNLADFINEELDNEDIVADQILPIIGSVLRDKYKYSFDSFTIPQTVNDFNKLLNETSKWTAVDVVLAYFNPSGQVILVNPKNPYHWDKARELTIDHLLVLYTKYLKSETGDEKIEFDAITAIEEMITGKDVYINKSFVDESVRTAPAAPKKVEQLPQTGKRRATPKYSVQVSNELFHNGNVEAWKKIITSFNTKYPGLEVIVYYENELINDLNSLFKWGKVKHHGLIMFQVVGEDIKDVSKLQKYLYEGASSRFEQFLHGPVGSVLNLF